MSGASAISPTDATWSPLAGRLETPLRWRAARRIRFSGKADLFDPAVPDEVIARVLAVVAGSQRHTYHLLTGQHERMRTYLNRSETPSEIWHVAETLRGRPGFYDSEFTTGGWPLPNLWVGVNVEDQKTADLRVRDLLGSHAAVKWLSCDPLLGPVDLRISARSSLYPGLRIDVLGRKVLHADGRTKPIGNGIDWVVVGGQTGAHSRPMHPDWVRALRDQCTAAQVPFYFTQWGDYLSAHVEDDPEMAGGRAFDHPRGGRSAAVIREPGPSGTMRTATTRALQPGERTRGAVLLDRDTIAVRVGRQAAGRDLDGRTWDEYPHRQAAGRDLAGAASRA